MPEYARTLVLSAQRKGTTMNVEIAQRLAELRRKSGLSQENLAERLGLSRQAISKWERAESSPDTDNLIALAKLYGISLDALLSTESILEDDIAFEARDRARETQGQGQGQGREFSPGSTPPTPPFQTPPSPPASQSSRWQSSYEVDADGCYLDNDGRPYRVKSALRTFPYPLVVVIIFMVYGFAFSWLYSWLIFLTIPFYYWIVKVVEDGLNRPEPARKANAESLRTTVGIVVLFVVVMVLILVAVTFGLSLWQNWQSSVATLTWL
jgi:transcriptional regulator with XRE-family HTH domain